MTESSLPNPQKASTMKTITANKPYYFIYKILLGIFLLLTLALLTIHLSNLGKLDVGMLVLIGLTILIGFVYFRQLLRKKELELIRFDGHGITFIHFIQKQSIPWTNVHSIQAKRYHDKYDLYVVEYTHSSGETKHMPLPYREDVRRCVNRYYPGAGRSVEE